MLEVFLFVVTVILVVLFWPIFVFLGLVALGLVVLAAVILLALAFPKEAGELVGGVAIIGAVVGLIWVSAKVLGEYDVAERVGAFVGRRVRALRRAHQRTRLKGSDG